MTTQSIIDHFIPQGKHEGFRSLKEEAAIHYEKDMRTWSEIAKGLPPKIQTITKYLYLVNGFCTNCTEEHPNHRPTCEMNGHTGPIYNFVTRCPECKTNTHIHYPDCGDYTGCSEEDLEIATDNQLDHFMREVDEARKYFSRDIRKYKNGVWSPDDEETYENMNKWAAAVYGEIRRRNNF